MHEQIQNAGRIAHDIGLATWFGGQVFGKFALNPVVRVIDDEPTRGKVVNTGWFTFNPIRTAGLAVGAAVHYVARKTEVARPQPAKLQRSIGALGNGALLSGTGLLVVNALLDRVAFTDPPKRRFLSRSRI